ncbi:MAG: DUF1512 family protein [Candidatus Aenigmatarchaeota archaeon]
MMVTMGLFDFFGGGGDMWGSVLWFLVFMMFMMFYPRLIVTQMLWKLDQSARMVEGLTKKAKGAVLRRISKNPEPRLTQDVGNFLEFFPIIPISLDPYGMVNKLGHIMENYDDRFDAFVDEVAPKAGKEDKENIKGGLSGAISLHGVSKIVRHYVELIRKTKNLQLAMVLQMQLPMIERLAAALLDGTESLSNGWPIGDSMGPFVAASMIGDTAVREIEKGTVVATKRLAGRKVFIVKAKGPGSRVGKIDKAIAAIVKRNRIAKIITMDAAVKLEGERTGSVAEGVGVAMGGIGVERARIEEVIVQRKIPIDSIVVKMSQEEAMQPVRAEMLAAIPRVAKIVEDRVKATKKPGAVIVVGVGNTSGVGNNRKDVAKAEQLARRNMAVMRKREQKLKADKKKNWWKDLLTGG